MFLPHPRVKVNIVGSLRDREVACSASDCQGSNFESCVWRTVSSQSSHHPQEVLLAQFSLYVHKGGLKPDSFHFIHFLCTVDNKIHDIKILGTCEQNLCASCCLYRSNLPIHIILTREAILVSVVTVSRISRLFQCLHQTFSTVYVHVYNNLVWVCIPW